MDNLPVQQAQHFSWQQLLYRQQLETALADLQTTTPVATPVVDTGSTSSSGSDYLSYTVSAPSSSWSITHNFGRVPRVTVYDESGHEMDADVYSTSTTVSVVHAEPTLGSAVLTA